MEKLTIGGANRLPFLKHYGAKSYLPEKVLPLENEWVKPRGGLWTSPIDSNWGWQHWNEYVNYRTCEKSNSFILKLDQLAKIFVIDSFEDLKNAPLLGKNLNFEYIATKYDAIWLTERGQNKTHLSKPIDLYGWDCETVLIINPNVVTQIELENSN